MSMWKILLYLIELVDHCSSKLLHRIKVFANSKVHVLWSYFQTFQDPSVALIQGGSQSLVVAADSFVTILGDDGTQYKSTVNIGK